jgi:hypothetical protein
MAAINQIIAVTSNGSDSASDIDVVAGLAPPAFMDLVPTEPGEHLSGPLVRCASVEEEPGTVV